MRSSNSLLLASLKTVRQYKAEAFRGQPRLRICSLPRRVYSSRFFLYDPAAPAMLCFPETVGDNQWKALSVCKNLSRQRNVAMPGESKNCFDEKRKESPAHVRHKKFVGLAHRIVGVAWAFVLTNKS
jgi:hypothetical protein